MSDDVAIELTDHSVGTVTLNYRRVWKSRREFNQSQAYVCLWLRAVHKRTSLKARRLYEENTRRLMEQYGK